MEDYSLLSERDALILLRLQLEEAFTWDNFALAQALSREIDEIQLRHWYVALAPAS
ncbi:MAG: hypothetical protein IJJ60_00760 [Clostridia bacterium]|nr:hypothetical protein [Clostridia bacterium]